MNVSDSLTLIITQGIEEIGTAPISFGLKIMIIFGVIYLFNSLFKTSLSVIDVLIHIIAFFKWLIFKIKKKDI